VTSALRSGAFDGRIPAFLIRGLRLTSDGGRAYDREDLLELRALNLAQDRPPLAGGRRGHM
jgi:hypothetical protein